MPRVTEIRVYPIKSCAGLSVGHAAVEPRGLSWDRRFMLVDGRGRFLTQREHPRMARLIVRENAVGWTVDARNLPSLELPRRLRGETQCSVRIWNDRLELAVAGARFDAWFSTALGFPCRLVQMCDRHRRPLKPGRGTAADVVSLADGAPVLLISEASLAALNRRLARPVPMIRFRPNLVVTADRPFAEDDWRRIRVGEAEFEVAWPCTRCVVTTIDVETARKDPDEEPIRTLKGFRAGREGVMFGQNLIPRRLGTVRVGDSVEVLEEVDR